MSSRLQKTLKYMPVELVFVMPAALFLLVVVFILSLSSFATANMVSESINDSFFNNFLAYGLFLLTTFAVCFGFVFGVKKPLKEGRFWIICTRLLLIVVNLLLFAILVSMYLTSVGVVFLSANLEYTAQMSIWHLQLDQVLRMSEFVHWLIPLTSNVPVFYSYINVAYSGLITLLLIVMFALPLFGVNVARKFLLSIFISVMICIPIWLMFPTLGPLQIATSPTVTDYGKYDELYLETSPVRNLYFEYESTIWGERVKSFSDFWEAISDAGRGQAISNNPSLHVIWGFIIMVFLFRINRFLGTLGGAVLVGDVTGTIFFLQHYAVDVITGFLVAYGSIALVDWLLRFEKEHFTVDEKIWFLPLVYARSFSVSVCNLVRLQKGKILNRVEVETPRI